jgi:ribosomal protein S18 acetylase RimI-like enzyme
MFSSDIYIRTFQPGDVPAMHRAFTQAFSDYKVTVKLSIDQFIKKFIEKLQLNFDMSAGAFDGDLLVGFIFANIGMYDNLLTAYNGGTGVIPSRRGMGLTSKIYDFLLPKYRQSKIQQALLEVLTINPAAIHVYGKLGFQEYRHFKCYRLESGTIKNQPLTCNTIIKKSAILDLQVFHDFKTLRPSYLDKDDLLNCNLRNEMILEAFVNNESVGYIIFQPEHGRLSQIAVHPDFRRRGIGTALLKEAQNNSEIKYLTLLNLEKKETGVDKFLTRAGFVNKIDQFEMRMSLG